MKIENHKSHKPNEFFTNERVFFSTGDLAQLTYFSGLSKVKGWTTHNHLLNKNRTMNCNHQPKVLVIKTKLLTNFSMILQILLLTF